MHGVSISAEHDVKTLAIAAGASLSSAAEIGKFGGLGIETDANWVTAAITFQVSGDGVTYKNLSDDAGVEVITGSLVASTCYSLDSILLKLYPWRYVKVRSGTAATAVTQAAGTSPKLHCKS